MQSESLLPQARLLPPHVSELQRVSSLTQVYERAHLNSRVIDVFLTSHLLGGVNFTPGHECSAATHTKAKTHNRGQPKQNIKKQKTKKKPK